MSLNYEIVQRFESDGDLTATFPNDPLASALGATLISVDKESGLLKVAFNPKDHFQQDLGIIQGGVVSAMLDYATAFAAMMVLRHDQGCATVNLNTSFMRPATPGTFLAYAEIEKKGGAFIFSRATLTYADNPRKQIATASAVLAVVQRSPTQ